jgi:hypothetical protein
MAVLQATIIQCRITQTQIPPIFLVIIPHLNSKRLPQNMLGSCESTPPSVRIVGMQQDSNAAITTLAVRNSLLLNP